MIHIYKPEKYKKAVAIIGTAFFLRPIYLPPFLTETLEKCSFLPAQLNSYLIFNRGSSKAKILTIPVRSAGPTGQAGIH